MICACVEEGLSGKKKEQGGPPSSKKAYTYTKGSYKLGQELCQQQVLTGPMTQAVYVIRLKQPNLLP